MTAEMAFFHPNFMLQIPHDDDQIHNSTSLAPILPSSTLQEFHGKRTSMSFCEEMNVHGEDELSDDGSQLGEKKRRLNIEQIRTLEKNFELGNKLEPERKMQLARALGLQPRQIAIWFQNRRARSKTKQLEKDYDLLKRHFDAVRAENHALQAHNHILHAKIMQLKTREQRDSINLNKDTEASCSNRSQSSSEIKLDISRTPAVDSPLLKNPNRPGLLGMPSLNRSNGMAQLFQNFPGPETHCPKTDQNGKEESLPNVFCGMDDQTGFWPWIEQQNFN